MGRIQAVIPDELDEKLRKALADRYGWRKGVLKEVITQALTKWLEGSETVNSLETLLSELEGSGVIDRSFAEETLRQRDIFEQNREMIELRYGGQVVVVCGGKIFTGRTFREALERARRECGDTPYYSESVGKVDYPSIRV